MGPGGWVRDPDHMFIWGPVRGSQIEAEFSGLFRTSAHILNGCFDRSADDKGHSVQPIKKIMSFGIGLDRQISISSLDSDLSAFNRISGGISHGSLKRSPCPYQFARNPQ